MLPVVLSGSEAGYQSIQREQELLLVVLVQIDSLTDSIGGKFLPRVQKGIHLTCQPSKVHVLRKQCGFSRILPVPNTLPVTIVWTRWATTQCNTSVDL